MALFSGPSSDNVDPGAIGERLTRPLDDVVVGRQALNHLNSQAVIAAKSHGVQTSDPAFDDENISFVTSDIADKT